VNVAFPVLAIALGIVILIFGKRLAVLGAAVGAIVGLAVLRLFNVPITELWALLIPVALAVVGFFAAGFAKGIINIVLLVFGALAGAAIVLNFLDLFNIDTGLLDWLLAVVGGVIGLVLIRRFSDWGLIILSALIGALLVTRGLNAWFPLQGVIGTLITLVLAGGSFAYQGGFLTGRKSTPQAPTATGGTAPPQ
jgi:hypothetical protein